MLFPTFGFLLFFLAVAAGLAVLEDRFTAKKALLVAASYFFYAQWDWRFCFLLAFSTGLSFIAGLLIGRLKDQSRQRLVLGIAIALHLGLLGIFKYLDFFVLSSNELAHLLGLEHELPFVEILLPVGISFFTFHGISYVTDVYRGDVAVCRNPLDMALYMSFFPQLVAGPIVRAAYFLPQLARPSAEPIPIGPAMLLILGGLFKKIVVANYLATGLVDPVFAAPTSYGGPDLLLATYGYAVQIYCDFSAYTDMAIALAALCGFRFPANFNQPYRAERLREFWQRWHISLSSWLRDYLYKPLGGNRRGRLLTYRNLLLTMLLGGLWHGAAWKFIAWGVLHGGGLAAERMVEPWLGRRAATPLGRAVAVVVVFHFVCLAWIFFRAEDFDVARLFIAGLFSGWAGGVQQAGPFVVGLIALGMAGQFLPDRLFDRAAEALGEAPVWGLGAAAGAAVAMINALGPDGIAPFIYFRF
ncbi:MAG TPA: MBOAT family O-acyltransferase [Stellaceae bacterium]|jgi:D-alanyl-lipoteichoic acid acyltransferase DltB (MBOAT superfamily)|nr:MBOAT family O-acyltransferase [Stellaceae bacterium]